MEYHKYANLFPLINGDDYNNLKEDIKKSGQLEPIYLYKDKIIDGRNRYRCCIDLGIEPIFKQYEGEGEKLLSFILSLNLHRRHLSEGQRAIIAAKLANLDPGRPSTSETVTIATVSQSDAANALDVSRASVNRANRILNQGTDGLIGLVESGKLAVLPASEVATLDEQDQNIIIARGEAEILAVAREIRFRNKNDLMFSSNEEDWLTPDSIVQLIYKMFANDFLDPCASIDNSHINCKLSYNKFDDGLNKSWSNYKVYCNPPNGITIKYWIDKVLSENIDEGLLLLPARTDTKWFGKLNKFPICFINGRLKFSNHSNSAPFPSMVVYIGKRENKFKSIFSSIGTVYLKDNHTDDKINIQSILTEGDEQKILNKANIIVKNRRKEEREKHIKLFNNSKLNIPNNKYQTIIIDPPWKNQQQNNIMYPVNGADYPTMSHSDLIKFGEVINKLSHKDCYLFLWTTIGKLEDGLNLIEEWGFRYVFNMIWNKVNKHDNPVGFQPTSFPRYTHEIILVAKRGSLVFKDTRKFYTTFTAERNEHSRKPLEFYELINRVCPGPIIDVFSREDWKSKDLKIDSYGLEVDKFE